MSCSICGNYNCCSSFHSHSEQESYEKYSGSSDTQLIQECLSKDEEMEDLSDRVGVLERALEILSEYVGETSPKVPQT